MDVRHADLSSSIAEEDWFVAGEGAGASGVAQFIASCDLQRDVHLVDLQRERRSGSMLEGPGERRAGLRHHARR